MTDHLTSSAGQCVVVHLLDSALGHSLQTWRFIGRDLITIGRGGENDVALADPHVSRAHARLVHDNGCWKLISTGRHGTLVDDRVVTEYTLHDHTMFRLGGGGPMLRFDTIETEFRRSETIDHFDSDMFSLLEIDESRKQNEVDQITSNDLFQKLQEQNRRRRATDGERLDDLTDSGSETR
jgi:predicted component of type VI protein secretion system